jgi:hypothetical protein
MPSVLRRQQCTTAHYHSVRNQCHCHCSEVTRRSVSVQVLRDSFDCLLFENYSVISNNQKVLWIINKRIKKVILLCYGVGIATGYWLDGWGSIASRSKRLLSTAQRPDRLWGPHNFLSNAYRGSFPGSKADVQCSWPLTIQCRGQECGPIPPRLISRRSVVIN